jgi:hypothetical protein
MIGGQGIRLDRESAGALPRDPTRGFAPWTPTKGSGPWNHHFWLRVASPAGPVIAGRQVTT